MNIFGIVFCLSLSFAVIVNGKFAPCGGSAKITKVICNGKDMETEQMCILKKAENSTLSVTFQADKPVKSITSVCHGIIGGIPVPFNGIDTNGCDGIQGGCPLAAGKTYTFTTQIPVKKIYPSIKLAIKWEELMDSKTDAWCLVIPAEIL